MYGKVVVFLCAAALTSAGYSGPPNYGYQATASPAVSSQQGTFGPVASNSGLKAYNGPTISPPVPGAFTATTKNGNPVSIPSYPPVQYSTTKSNEISYSYSTPAAAYPSQYAGVTDYPASYSSQNYAQYPQAYSQAYPQTQVYSQAYPQTQVYSQAYPQTQSYQAYPQGYSQAYQQAVPQTYAYPSQVISLQAYPAQSQYQAYPTPTQYRAYQAPAQYSAAQYPGYPSGYSAVQYAPAPVQYSATPIQYSSAPAVSHVQYSGSDGSYSWRKK